MLPAVALCLALTANDPQTVVLVGRRSSLSQAEANALSRAISTQLQTAKVPLRLDADAARAALSRLALKDASACNGRKACLTELGRQLNATHLISLSLSQVGSDRSVALELLRVEDGVVLEKDALILSAGAAVTADLVAPFAAKVRARLVPEAPPDAPVVVAPPVKPVLAPEPPPVVVAPVLPPAPAPVKSRVAPIALGAGAVVALAVGTGLLVSGLGLRADAYQTKTVDGVLRSPYPASEVQSKAGAGSVQVGIASAVGAVGLGLGAAAVITW